METFMPPILRAAALRSVVPLILLFAVPAVLHAATLYTDGTSTYDYQAFPISNGEEAETTDSFMLSQSATVTGADFVAWVDTNSPPSSVDWSIGSSEFGSNLASGTADPSNSYIEQNTCCGYSIYDETFSIPSLSLGAGTYYLTLGGAISSGGDVYWDANPTGSSTAAAELEEIYGSVRPETFDILGTENASATPEPSSLLLLSTGLLGLAAAVRRKLVPAR